MSGQDCSQRAVDFDCAGSRLLGVLHQPETALDLGVVTVVAGGPQYRAGCGRQLQQMARHLADRGYPVLRFDQRGVGDSEGEFLGFHRMAEDLQAAVAALIREAPSVRRVVLWGGCDAASAILLNAWKLPEVAGVMLANPFLTMPSSEARLRRRHYLSRLGELSFWKKVVRLEYNPMDYLRPASTGQKPVVEAADGAGDDSQAVAIPGNFPQHALQGLREFQRPMLFVMSGHSPTRREFDDIVESQSDWAGAYAAADSHRVDLPEADQTFSTQESRDAVNRAALDWLEGLPAIAQGG